MSIGPTVPSDGDALVFRSEPVAPAVAQIRPWRVLIVDDDEQVHEATRFALRGASILDRPLEFVHARSGAEGLLAARASDDIAVALIDVVMETSDAGLRLVKDLRGAGFADMRIVLRTGYPGYAPEMSVISDYEIDDYRTKDELTRTRLLTVLTASIRAYNQIRAISRSRAGLQMIVESATGLFQRPKLELFSQGVLTQIAALLGANPNGFVCATLGGPAPDAAPRIVSAAGKFATLIGMDRSALSDPAAVDLLEQVVGQHGPVIRDGAMALHFRSEDRRELFVFFEAHGEIPAADLDILKLFSTNIAIGFENLALVEALDRLAYYDPVLKTPNLNAFEAELSARLQGDSPRGRLALTDIDSFRSILAAHGPGIAHDLLRAIYEKLRKRSPDTLSVARIGDGTFGLIGDSATVSDDLVPSILARPFVIDGVRMSPTATTAIVELDGMEPDALAVTRSALAALLHAKQTGLGRSVVFDESMRAAVERRHRLRAALAQAVEHCDGLAVHLQPKFDLASGTVVGAEALLRWTLDGEAISPAEFIPKAEANGSIRRLTEFVIDSVAGWRRGGTGNHPVPVAVNLSMADLNTHGCAAWILDRLAAAGLDPSSIEFEVTEGIAMQSAGTALQEVAALRAQGFRLALDDFGTGYSSLAQFERLPIDVVKIDRSFVDKLTVPTARKSLAAIVVAMTEAMAAACVAEGIETEEQKQALMYLGCTVGQGFLLGRPVPIEDFDRTFLSGAVH